jgi:nucleolin
LFVGNLPFNVNESTLRQAFADFGQVNEVRIPTDRETGKPKGYGYVQFSSVDEAQEALNQMNGQDVAGRRIRLDFSSPPANRQGNDGGRGRGGRGGFTPRGNGRGRGGFAPRGGRGGSSFSRNSQSQYQGTRVSFDD